MSDIFSEAKSFIPRNNLQLIALLGIALSGLAAFVTTYDALFKVDSLKSQCDQSGELKSALQTRFIVLLVISCLAVVLGLLIAWFVRNSPAKIVLLGIAGAGLAGILYAVVNKYNHAQSSIKLGLSWASFVAFVILGVILGFRSGDASKMMVVATE